MTRRYNIIKELCINAPMNENSDDQSEEATAEELNDFYQMNHQMNAILQHGTDSVGMEVVFSPIINYQ